MERQEKVLTRLKGPIVPVNICFHADGTVNYEAMRAYVDWLCKEKVPVILLTGGSSEFASLDDREIFRLTSEVCQAIDGRSVFIAGTGSWKPSVTRDFLKQADEIGVDVVKIQLQGNWQDLSAEYITRYYDLIEGAAGIPLFAAVGISTNAQIAAVAELARRPHIIGMKNDGTPFYNYYDFIRRTRNEQFVVVSGGQMRNFVFGYQIGSPAYLCTIAPFRPDLSLQFYQLLLEKQFEDAWEFVYRYEDPWLEWAVDHDWLVTMKSCIHMLGLYPNNLLGHPKPLPPPDAVEETRSKIGELFGGLHAAT